MPIGACNPNALPDSHLQALVRALFQDKTATMKGSQSPKGPTRVAASFKYAGANRKKARAAQTVVLTWV